MAAGSVGGWPWSRFYLARLVEEIAGRGASAIGLDLLVPEPDRLDPPKRLLRQAYELGCQFTIDTDAHAPGQLDWLDNGCERAVACEVPADRVLNTWSVGALLARTGTTRPGG